MSLEIAFLRIIYAAATYVHTNKYGIFFRSKYDN